MPTWSELKHFARSNYEVEDDDDEDTFAVLFTLPGERRQLVRVSRVIAQELEREREWAVFQSYVCRGRKLEPERALRKNASLLIGALAIDGAGDYFITHAAQLDTMDAAEFEVPIAQIAKTADSLEAELTGEDRY